MHKADCSGSERISEGPSVDQARRLDFMSCFYVFATIKTKSPTLYLQVI